MRSQAQTSYWDADIIDFKVAICDLKLFSFEYCPLCKIPTWNLTERAVFKTKQFKVAICDLKINDIGVPVGRLGLRPQMLY